eukprot:GHVR01087245.1.p1 GENE.GHVR01087245.1~~GHVR01087245.1.p1  ORF type:complete len:240 (-),score=45.92 GHVR01087245.1:430-1149(-)
MRLYSKLLSGCDRTGIIYEHLPGGILVPLYIISAGRGDRPNGMKIEWMSVCHDKLYVGSIGKEYVDQNGNITHLDNLWIVTIDANGHMTHVDWTYNYQKMRVVLGAEWPGYLIHEAINWSEVNKQWIVLPRRRSQDMYNENTDEEKGTNLGIFCSMDYNNCKVKLMGSLTNTRRGFSSFKFIPGTEEQLLLVLKSSEDKITGEQLSYVSIVTIDGVELLTDSTVPSKHKYEGVEFVIII